MNKLKLIVAAALLAGAVPVVSACGSDYDPDLCAFWTDMYNLNDTGSARVEMDRYCER